MFRLLSQSQNCNVTITSETCLSFSSGKHLGRHRRITLEGPAIAADETRTGETLRATRLPEGGSDRRIAVDLGAVTAADVVVLDSFMVAEFAAADDVAALDEALAEQDRSDQFLPALLDV